MEGNFIYIFVAIIIVAFGWRTRSLLIRQRKEFEVREKLAKDALQARLREYGGRNASLNVADLLAFIDIPTLFDVKIPPKNDGKKKR